MDLVSVIVVNWNGRHLLPGCLESLKNQKFKRFSIILVDNGSTDTSVAFVTRDYADVEVIRLSRNVGFAAANNVAFKMVRTEYVALLNNDAVADPMWLEHAVEALRTHPEAGFIASKILYFDHPTTIDRAGDSYTTAGTGYLRGRGVNSKGYDKREWIFGACAAAGCYRRSLLDDVGFFDGDFFLLHEDVDLSFRAQLQGYRCLYVPEAVVYHKTSQSIVRDSPISVYYGHRNVEWVYVKNMPGRLIMKTILPHILYNVAAFLFFASKGRGKEFLKAKVDAARGLKRPLKQRRKIQSKKCVDEPYLWDLFEKERLLPRLKMRFANRSQTQGSTEPLNL